MLIALIALVLLVGCLALRGSDWTRPHIALLVPWYGAVALSQLRLTDYQTPWTTKFAALALGGPLVLAAGAAISDGGASRSAFAEMVGVRHDYARLRTIARVLLAGAVLGSIIKLRIQGGFALFSSEIDATRGSFHIPAPVTVLTDGFFLSAWLTLISIYATRGTGRTVPRVDAVLLTACVFGVGVSASRNSILITLAVPLIFAYVIGVLRRPRAIALLGIALTFLAVTSGLFYIRTSQHSGSAFESSFYSITVPKTPWLLRPLLPIYVSTTAPLETLNRVVHAFPSQFPYQHGWYSVSFLPKQTHLHRANLYAATAALSAPYFFNVATYEGPLFGDGGPAGVLLGSATLGLAIGLTRRRLARGGTLAGAAVWSYVTYTVFFMSYDQLYSIFLTSFTDILTLWLALRLTTKQATEQRPVSAKSALPPPLVRRSPIGRIQTDSG